MDRLLSLFHRSLLEAPACYLAWPAAAMVMGTFIAMLSRKAAARLAAVPRTSGGLVGIATAPFIHASPAHLAADLPAFIGLGALILRHHETRFVEVAVAIALAQGALLWLFGRKAAHIGMSGVIFGFFGYLLSVAWFTRTMPDLLIAGGVLLYYGGMLAGVRPVRKGTSWEGHLFGLLAGIAVAWLGMR